MVDLVIIGLGPAGATLARLLDSGLSVVCIDQKSHRPGGFEKPCGGLISPDAQKALAVFELTLPTSVLASPQIFSVKTLDLKSRLTRQYQRFYINVNRHRFDRWLCSLLPPGVQVLEDSRCTGAEKIPDGYRVFYTTGGVAHTLETRLLVGADGANSVVRRMLYPHKKIRRYTAIQQWFPDQNLTPFYSCVFDEENTDCYSWSISKDNVFIFGGAYPANHCRERFEAQKKALERQGVRFGEPTRTEACLVLRPKSPFDLCCGRDGAFLIGEAGGFISPSSLEGISSALITARLLAEALNEGKNPQKQYRRACIKLRIKIAIKLLKCPFMYWPPLRRLVLRSGVDSI